MPQQRVGEYPYPQISKSQRALLVIGDSIFAGRGASKPMYTVVGRIAMWVSSLNPTIINLSQDRGTIADMIEQGKMVPCQRYGQFELILIGTGANDVLMSFSLKKIERNLTELLEWALKAGKCVALVSPPDVGKAPLFWWPWNWLLSRRSRQIHNIFKVVVNKMATQYDRHDTLIFVSILDSSPKCALDGTHPTDEWHKDIYDRIQRVLEPFA